MLPPNDRRGFVHKSRFTRGLIGLATGGPLAGATAFVAPSRRSRPRAPVNALVPDSGGGCAHTFGGRQARVSPITGLCEIVSAAAAQSAGGCCPGIQWVLSTNGMCRNVLTGATQPQVPCDGGGGTTGGGGGGVFEGGGAAVMGQYGAALHPSVASVRTLDCLPGMVLGTDELCYNKRDLTNKERKWPRGRRPLLTGGDRNAITQAARAARAIQRTEKQLRKLGMLKAPARRAAPKKRQPLLLPPGSPSIINVE